MSFPLYQQATFLLGDQLPKLEKLESSQVRRHLEAYDLMCSRLPSDQPKPPLSQTLSPAQFDQLTWLEVAKLMQQSAAVAPSFADDSDEEEEEVNNNRRYHIVAKNNSVVELEGFFINGKLIQ